MTKCDGVYLHDWAGDGFFQMAMDFEGCYLSREQYERDGPPPNSYVAEQIDTAKRALADPKYDGIEVLLASYAREDYNGDAFVLFRRDGKLYEVNAKHCSCFGLEGCWSPEETTAAELRHRLENGRLGRDKYSANHFADELAAVLDGLDVEAA